MMHKNKSVDVHQFAMVPKAEIPRSQFSRQSSHKTTFDAGYLVPVYVDEVLPGDTFNLKSTFFARMATPIFPVMDNLYLDSFFFFVPNRLIWDNWKKFMGEQKNPNDSVDFTIPKMTCPTGGYDVGSLEDYFGLPTKGQILENGSYDHSALWHRAYNLIYNEWFRDENLQNSVTVMTDDGPDDPADYKLLRRGKRHDYFTSCLPWTQKGDPVRLPLGTTAPVYGDIVSDGDPFGVRSATDDLTNLFRAGAGAGANVTIGAAGAGVAGLNFGADGDTVIGFKLGDNVYADLSEATAATINQLRQSFQIQKLLERDARGGTRYTELVRAHFGVVSPDARLQRPEYLGGGSTPINMNPVAQTSSTSTTPLGNLAAFGTALGMNHGFSASFTEHGVIIGLVSVRADLTYQQGLHRMWSRKTKYDFYFPAFAALGEQAVLRKEIYCNGDSVNNDEKVFGYQERWAEYRYKPSQISGYFRSSAAGTLDPWHLAQNFQTAPELGGAFIEERPPLDRVLAVQPEAEGTHFLMDSFFDNKIARPMPLYSVPGLIDHF